MKYLFVSDRSPYEQMHKSGVEKIIREIAKRTKIDKNLSPHCFRRTLAQSLIEKGAEVQDVQKILGHSKIETTTKYFKVNQAHVQAIHRRFIA